MYQNLIITSLSIWGFYANTINYHHRSGIPSTIMYFKGYLANISNQFEVYLLKPICMETNPRFVRPPPPNLYQNTTCNK